MGTREEEIDPRDTLQVDATGLALSGLRDMAREEEAGKGEEGVELPACVTGEQGDH